MRQVLVFLASLTLHVAVVAATFVAMPSLAPEPVELPPVLPVELLEIAEETNIRPAVETEEPEPEEPEPEAEEQTQSETAQSPELPDFAEAPAALPAPEPEPVPEPAPLEPDAPERETVEPEPNTELDPRDFAQARPRVRPQQRQTREEEADPLDRIAALLDKLPDDEAPPPLPFSEEEGGEQAASDRTRAPAGLQSDMTLSDLDALRVQIQPCWTIPAGAANAETLVVSVRMHLNPDGSLSRAPEVVSGKRDPFFRAAADSALRAILRCQPFDMPVEHYEDWKTVVVDFDPRYMLQGR